MATTPPVSTLFEHVYPEELTLAIERGAHARHIACSIQGVDQEQLHRWLSDDVEPLVFEVILTESTPRDVYMPALRTIFDAIETWISAHSISPRERCVIRTQNDDLARACVAEMRRRYTGDPTTD